MVCQVTQSLAALAAAAKAAEATGFRKPAGGVKKRIPKAGVGRAEGVFRVCCLSEMTSQRHFSALTSCKGLLPAIRSRAHAMLHARRHCIESPSKPPLLLQGFVTRPHPAKRHKPTIVQQPIALEQPVVPTLITDPGNLKLVIEARVSGRVE